MKSWRRYLRFFGPNVEADVDDELRFHLEQRIADYERQGLTRANAELRAHERFGDVIEIREHLRTHDERRAHRQRRRERFGAFRQDIRLTLRTLSHARAWTAGVVLTLAIGIGLAVAVFTVADSLLIHPLALHDPDHVVVLWGTARDGRTDHFPFLYADAREYARRTTTLARVEFFSYGGALPVPMDLAHGVARVRRSLVTGGYFDLLGVKPLLGRALGQRDDTRGAAPVAVLSYIGWQRLFGGDRTVIGQRIALHSTGTAFTIVGVMPRGLDYPQGVDLWSAVTPNSKPLGDQPIYAELNGIGRLKPGQTVGDARAELSRFFAATPGDVAWGVTGIVRSINDDILGNTRPAVLAFAAAAAVLLLITCINVANLLLVRGRARVRELAVRAALGASRIRLLAQLLAESALLALGGGLAGALLAAIAVRVFVALAPPNTPRLDEIHIGVPVVACAVAATAMATLLFAVLPTLVASRIDIQDALRAGTRSNGHGRSFQLGTQSLVIGQMALALVVLCIAGLVGRSLLALSEVPLTFDADRVLVVELALPNAYVGSTTKQVALDEQLTQQLDSLDGVRAVAPVFTVPLAPVGGVFGRIAAEGQSDADLARNPSVDYELAMPNYFSSFGIPLLRGRAFTRDDRNGSPFVAIVTESFARQYWPHDDPIGKRLKRGSDRITVVGVVADTHYRSLANPRPVVYLPLEQLPFPFAPTTLLIATKASPTALVASIRRLIDDAAPGVAVVSALPLESYAGPALAQPRMNAMLLGIFATAALVLAAVGLFGVMATTVRQRTREFGIRMALGATPEQLRASVLLHALTLASGGLGIGLAVALLATRTLRSLLFQISPTDVPTLVAAGGVLLAVALLAAYLPARRAQCLDPVSALRME